MDYFSATLQQSKGTVKAMFLVLDEEGDDQTDRPGHSSQAMYHHVGLLEVLFDEIGCRVEMGTEIEGIPVVCLYVHEVGDVARGVIEVDASGCCEDCLDGVF